VLAPQVISVAAESPAAAAGIQVGDHLVAVDGQVPRDVIAYRLLVDEADPVLAIRRSGQELQVMVAKEAGEALGAEVSSAVFDRVKTCDNHCEFCFIYQLPKGMRRSLYLKDDDYRLSFLYGNFTTLTRFTELDLERVLRDGLSPLYVSIHSTDPALRASMLRNRRGAVSLRWLRALLDAGVTVHGQIVVCPGVNDGPALERTLVDILDDYPELATVACVPLGLSRFSTETTMRAHQPEEAAAVLDTVETWQGIFQGALGRRLVFAADEYYLLAGRPFPPADAFDGFVQHENGIGMASAFAATFDGSPTAAVAAFDAAVGGVAGHGGFFASVDGAPAQGYRAPRLAPNHALAVPVRLGATRSATGFPDPNQGHAPDGSVEPCHRREPGPVRPVTIVTGEYGAQVLAPILAESGWLNPSGPVHLLPVRNEFFGGTIAVTGLLTGTDVARALAGQPEHHRFLLPDVCLSNGRFLDDVDLGDLPRPVDVVATDGASLRQALEAGV